MNSTPKLSYGEEILTVNTSKFPCLFISPIHCCMWNKAQSWCSLMMCSVSVRKISLRTISSRLHYSPLVCYMYLNCTASHTNKVCLAPAYQPPCTSALCPHARPCIDQLLSPELLPVPVPKSLANVLHLNWRRLTLIGNAEACPFLDTANAVRASNV